MEDKRVVEGEVVKVLKFGAFVKLPDGKQGFLHISEIAQAFVSDVGDFLAEGDRILVKILGVNRKEQLELSYKQAGCVKVKGEVKTPAAVEARASRPRSGGRLFNGLPVKPAPQTFEEKLKLFMRHSEERQGEVRRNLENKRGGRSRF